MYQADGFVVVIVLQFKLYGYITQNIIETCVEIGLLARIKEL
jgi:hypothetical protein